MSNCKVAVEDHTEALKSSEGANISVAFAK